MSIRPYKESDFSCVKEIYASSKLDELRFETEKFELLPLDADHKRFQALKESDIYVYDDGDILGYGAVCGSEIRGLYIKPSARGKGVGQKLLKHMLSIINGNVTLFVARSNEPAIGLYSKYGFELANDFETDYNGKSVIASKMILVGKAASTK